MPGRAASDIKIRDTRVADALPGIDSAADIFTLRQKRGGGSKETIYRLRGQEAFGDLALSDLAQKMTLYRTR